MGVLILIATRDKIEFHYTAPWFTAPDHVKIQKAGYADMMRMDEAGGGIRHITQIFLEVTTHRFRAIAW